MKLLQFFFPKRNLLLCRIVSSDVSQKEVRI